MKPTRFIDSVNCAIEGILYTARTQKHMRRHFLAALAVLGLAEGADPAAIRANRLVQDIYLGGGRVMAA